MNRAGKDNWQHCTPEVIKEVVAERQRRSRRAMLKRIGLTSAGLFTVVAGITFWWASRKPTREEFRRKMIIPIACADVISNLSPYHSSNLDDAMTRRIKCHLSRCRSCQTYYHTHFRDTAV